MPAGGADIRSFQPSARIRDRVASIQLVEVNGGGLTVLPAVGAVLGLQLAGRVKADDGLLSTMGVTGVLERARRFSYLGTTRSLLVRFTPQGATCLGLPAWELTQRSIGLDDLLPRGTRAARARVLEASSVEQSVERLEALLASLPYEPDPQVDRALRLMLAGADEDVRVARTARAVGLSERQLERRFKERVGLSAKKFMSLKRFERAVTLARSAPSLTHAAYAAGYFDQSHFIRDCRRFAGVTPGELARR